MTVGDIWGFSPKRYIQLLPVALQITGRMEFLHRMCVYIGGIDLHQKLNFDKIVTYGVSERLIQLLLSPGTRRRSRKRNLHNDWVVVDVFNLISSTVSYAVACIYTCYKTPKKTS